MGTDLYSLTTNKSYNQDFTYLARDDYSTSITGFDADITMHKFQGGWAEGIVTRFAIIGCADVEGNPYYLSIHSERVPNDIFEWREVPGIATTTFAVQGAFGRSFPFSS